MDKKYNYKECKAGVKAIEDAMYVMGGKWKLRIIAALTPANLRFNELQRIVEGISPKVLSNELKKLELNGFVSKKVEIESSVKIEYELTEYAKTLDVVLRSMMEWSKKHKEKLRSGEI